MEITEAYAVTTISLEMRPPEEQKVFAEWPHLAGIPLPSGNIAEVTLLIGADHPDAFEVIDIR